MNYYSLKYFFIKNYFNKKKIINKFPRYYILKNNFIKQYNKKYNKKRRKSF